MSDALFNPSHALTRRWFCRAAVSAGLCALTGDLAMADGIFKKPVPQTGELLPVIGLGTWQTFDVGSASSAREPLRQVLREFVRLGGSVIDSSPMYGKSESVTGDLAVELGVQNQLFVATKVWITGRDAGIGQLEESFKRLRRQRVDLMQVHNLVDYRTHLATLRRWKEEGKVRYLGVTHYTASAYDELARVMTNEPLDFVQLNYSLAEADAERRLLPLAADKRMAVLVNRPFATGQMFRKTRGKPLPPWAKEFGCASWAQFFLKFVVSHPAVTCAIPATSNVEHLRDNMQAGFGAVPLAAERGRMARYFADL